MRKRIKWRLTPTQTLVLGFLTLIIIGTILLHLPFSSNSGYSISFVDAIFTATSAACVTGQTVVTTAVQWSIFGKGVILVLIQVGGLGIITLATAFSILLRRKLDIKSRLTIQASFGQENTGGMVRLVIGVLKTALIVEGIGAIFLTIAFWFSPENSVSFGTAAAWGLFHSVSAFCNAGFDIIGTNSLMPYVSDPIINITIMLLVICGGIGFPLWLEFAKLAKAAISKKASLKTAITQISVHAKIIITYTVALLVVGAVFFLLFEWDNPKTMGNLSWFDKIMASFFQSTTMRTAGFTTLNQGELLEPSQFLSCVLMFIGGASAGTAGGIKITTFAVILLAVGSVLQGKPNIQAFHRVLGVNVLQKALAVTMLVMSVWLGGTIFLCFSEESNAFHPSFLDLLFESASATNTVGVSTGLTPFLSIAGRWVCIVTMFLGRLGPMTVSAALASRVLRKSGSNAQVKLPTANVLIG
ncbi:MAG: Trk family potassium uptake protein [Oscillospiraceae bacterium]|jgi:trk system potassium uptake protein TrkH|nr:Trk family potassium uptake protein [Oscillospiraceae bacterium]